MAQAVATLGGEGELRHAAAVAGLDAGAGERAAGVLADAGILDAGRPLRMTHPLVRAAVTGELGAPTRPACTGAPTRCCATTAPAPAWRSPTR